MISLAYNRDFQIQFLISLLSSQKFFSDTCAVVHATDFDLPACRLIYEVARSYFKKYKALPPFTLLAMEVQKAISGADFQYETSIQPEEYESLVGVLHMINRAPTKSESEIAYFRDQIIGYLSFVRLARAQEMGLPPAEQINEISKIKMDISRVNSQDVMFINGMDTIQDDPNKFRLGIGIPNVDPMVSGGLERGQIGMVVACTGVGKTNAGINALVNATIRNKLSLFITLELPGARIIERYQGMLVGIEASNFKIARAAWSDADRSRMTFANSPEFRYRNNMTVADCSIKSASCADIERVIVAWKTRMIEQLWYSEDDCVLVFVDWLEKINSDGLDMQRNASSDVVWKTIIEKLGEIGRRNNVIMWTATQGTKDAVGKEILTIAQTAHGYHIHDGLDLSAGIAPVIDPALREDGQVVTEDNWDSIRDEVEPPCDRRLIWTFMKTRFASAAGKARSFYQGPSLRFWLNKNDAELAMRLTHTNDLDKIYRLMTTGPERR